MEHPIIFSTPMVKAILEGTKTQTRRVVNPQPDWSFPSLIMKGEKEDEGYWKLSPNDKPVKFPYGKVEDILWVRETWQHTDSSINFEPGYVYKATDPDWGTMEDWKWKPSIFMPRKAARIFLEITNIRVERLQDINEEDAIAEGVEVNDVFYKDYLDKHPACFTKWSAKESYTSLWQKINGEESWNQNPFVWVIEFKKVTK